MRDFTPSCPEPVFAKGWLRTHTQTVQPDWIDYNGHMNVAYYTKAFDIAFDEVLEDYFGTTLNTHHMDRNNVYFLMVRNTTMQEMLLPV